jgi:hypothetical protein
MILRGDLVDQAPCKAYFEVCDLGLTLISVERLEAKVRTK